MKIEKSSPFHSNVVLLTGASAGIGRELALQLSDQGARLALAARTKDPLERTAADCRSRGGEVLALSTDVSDPDQCAALVRNTVERYGRIDTLINNAGVTMYGYFDRVTDLKLFETLFRVNVLGSIYCTHYALPYLKQSAGRIVGISSLTGKTGVPTRSGYAATKHAMAGFFDSIRIELAGSGVTVTMIYPGFVRTGMREHALGSDGKPVGQSHLDERGVMPVERCAGLIWKAAAGRRRELVLSARGRIGVWLKLIAPGLVDRLAFSAIRTGRT